MHLKTKTVFVYIIVLLLAMPVMAEEKVSDDAYLNLINKDDDVDQAVEKGLKWMVSQQDLTYGYFNGSLKNAYTALACLALMGHGHFPGRSEYGVNLRKAIKFLVKQAIANNGYLGADGGRMYGHGIATLVLTEAYGMMEKEKDNQDIKKALDLAIAVILKAQVQAKNVHHGGWRYLPNSTDADLSVTVWQILALRSAQNCRLDVPDYAVKNALNYVRRSYSPQAKGFCYQPGGNSASVAMRVAGVVCMKALGADKDTSDIQMIESSAEILKDQKAVLPGNHFYYRAYYFATAANMLDNEYRQSTLKSIEKLIISLQEKTGEFKKHTGHDGGVYATAFSLICLSVRNQYLPIYQE